MENYCSMYALFTAVTEGKLHKTFVPDAIFEIAGPREDGRMWCELRHYKKAMKTAMKRVKPHKNWTTKDLDRLFQVFLEEMEIRNPLPDGDRDGDK